MYVRALQCESKRARYVCLCVCAHMCVCVHVCVNAHLTVCVCVEEREGERGRGCVCVLYVCVSEFLGDSDCVYLLMCASV